MRKTCLIIGILLACVIEMQAQNNNMSEVYALKRQAEMQKEEGSIADALETIDKALDICEKTIGKNDTNYVELLCIKAEFYYYLGELEKSLQLIKVAKRLQIKIEGKMSKQYIELLQDEAACHLQLGNQQLALDAMEQAIRTASNCIDTTKFYYATILFNASFFRRELGLFEESVKPALRAVKIMESLKATDSLEYPAALSNCAQSLYLTGAYNEAYYYAAQSVDFYKKTVANTDYNYLFTRLTLTQCMNAMGMYDSALALVIEVKRDFVNTYGKDNPDYCTIQGVAADIYSAKSDYAQCIRVLMDAIAVSESIYGIDAMENINLIGRLGNVYYLIGNGTKALHYAKRCVAICCKNEATNSVEYAQSLDCLASAYKNMGIFDSAYTHQSLALKIIEKELGSRNKHYLHCLAGLAEICRLNHDFDEAFNYQSMVIELADSLFGEMSQPSAYSRLSLADIYNDLGYYSKARSIAEESLEILQTVYDDRYHKDCRNVMERLTIYYNNECKYEMAINISSDLVRYAQNHLSEDNNDYSHYLYLLSMYYSNAGQFPKAVQLGEESRKIIAKYYNHESTVYVDALNNLAIQYKNLGNISDAIRCREEELSLRKKMYGLEVSKYRDCIIDLSQLYASIGEEDKVSKTMIPLQLFFIRQTNQIMKHTGYKDTIPIPDEIKLLDNSDEFLNRITNYYEELAMAIEEDFDIKNNLRANDYLYEQLLTAYSLFTFSNENTNKTLVYLLKLLPLREKKLGKENSNYAQVLGSIANCYARLEKYDSAMVYIKEALKIETLLVDSTSPGVTSALVDLIAYARMAGAQDSVEIWTSKLTGLFTKQVKQKFIELSSSERYKFWQIYSGWFNYVLPQMLYTNYSESLLHTVSDAVLFSKGMLLSTDIGLRNLIKEKGDEDIVKLYDSLRFNRLLIDKIREMPVGSRLSDVDSLERVATKQERMLTEKSSAYGDFMSSLSVTHKEVGKSLKKGEAAVEFISYEQNDSSYYAAIIIRHGEATPHYVKLKPQASRILTLDNKNKNGYDTSAYSNAELSKWLWEPLSTSLEKCNVVYFSPSGALHQVAVEHFRDFQDSTALISNRWQLHRVSSIRELTLKRNNKFVDSVAIYGGMDYNLDTSTLKRSYLKNPNDNRGINPLYYYDTRSIKNGKLYLNSLLGTEKEALSIDSLMSTLNIGTLLYLDTNGTESSFKRLSGRKIPVIAIGTHGLYLDAVLSKVLPVFTYSNNNANNREDEALSRSCLFFSGANHALQGETIPEGIDDGILSAREISRMDLRGTDLLVLSACQTGLGDIAGDGVFGLQRGFKKAGVNTIVMSLWEVHDFATQLLMGRFYGNLFVKKMSKQDALKAAQEYVKNYEMDEAEWASVKRGGDGGLLNQTQKGKMAPPHDPTVPKKMIKPMRDPYYWAGFILLDGLN